MSGSSRSVPAGSGNRHAVRCLAWHRIDGRPNMAAASSSQEKHPAVRGGLHFGQGADGALAQRTCRRAGRRLFSNRTVAATERVAIVLLNSFRNSRRVRGERLQRLIDASALRREQACGLPERDMNSNAQQIACPNVFDGLVDYLVVGGSYAGLSAALHLARARRSVLIVDAGERRNDAVDQAGGRAHGLLTQDGLAPAAIAAQARQQLSRYPSVQWHRARLELAESLADGTFLLSANDFRVRAGRVILATGMRDVLPPIPGLAERWGRSIFNCPYCHGFELEAGPVGIVASGSSAFHLGLMLPDWAPTTMFLNRAFNPSPAEHHALSRRGTTIDETPVLRIRGHADLHMDDGRILPMKGLFIQPQSCQQSDLALQLGCDVEQSSTSAFVKVNACQETSVRHVYACGDMARASGSLALAVGDGAMAGVAAHQSSLA